MKAYKGFNKDMTCRGFQFEQGKTYEEDEAILCEKGFTPARPRWTFLRITRPLLLYTILSRFLAYRTKEKQIQRFAARKLRSGRKSTLLGFVRRILSM